MKESNRHRRCHELSSELLHRVALVSRIGVLTSPDRELESTLNYNRKAPHQPTGKSLGRLGFWPRPTVAF